jgi:hypothetical protein
MWVPDECGGVPDECGGVPDECGGVLEKCGGKVVWLHRKKKKTGS